MNIKQKELGDLFPVKLADHCIDLYEAIRHEQKEVKREELIKQYNKAANYYNNNINNITCFYG